MEKKFIKIQLFGDPSGDPQQNTLNPSGNDSLVPDQGDDAAPNDAAALIEFRKRHVTREEYEREKNRADSYLKAILENREEEIAQQEGSAEKVNADDLCKKLFVEDNSMSDIEYVTNALNLRKARIASGERDPFLPDSPEDRDIEIAQNVAEVLEECVRLANGDNTSFIALLQGRMKDGKLPKFFR